MRESFVRRVVPSAFSGELKRAADRFALIAAAGELATKWGLTGWREGEAVAAAERCFKEWVKTRGTTGSSDIEAAIRQIRAFLGAFGESRFQVLSPGQHEALRIIPNRAGFKRLNDDDETEYLILQEPFRNELCAGFSHQSVLKELDRRELLVRDQRNMTIKPRLPGLGTTRVYCIRQEIFARDEC